MSDATPRPWRFDGRDWPLVHAESGGECVADCFVQRHTLKGGYDEAQANALLIVRYVNCHGDLVAALRLVQQWMLGGQPGPFSDQKVLEILEAALAKADPHG